MRTVTALLFCSLGALALLSPACSDGGLGGGTNKPDMAQPADLAAPPDLTAPVDLTVPPDLTPPPPQDMAMPSGDFGAPGDVTCGDQTCAAPDVCCVGIANNAPTFECADSCASSDAGMTYPLTCDGPEDCSGGQYCCVSGSAGSSGGIMTEGAQCTTPCNFNLDFSGYKLTTRLCHQNSDCTGSGMVPLFGPSDYCCHYDGQPEVHFCATTVNFQGVNIVCP